MPISEVCVAKFAYKAENNAEISFAEGDTIAVTKKSDGDWWYGKVEGGAGWFPSSFVIPCGGGVIGRRHDSFMPKSEKYICTFAYTQTESDELSTAVGDIVVVVQKSGDGWYLGYPIDSSNNTVGWVPANHLTLHDESDEKALQSNVKDKTSIKIKVEQSQISQGSRQDFSDLMDVLDSDKDLNDKRESEWSDDDDEDEQDSKSTNSHLYGFPSDVLASLDDEFDDGASSSNVSEYMNVADRLSPRRKTSEMLLADGINVSSEYMNIDDEPTPLRKMSQLLLADTEEGGGVYENSQGGHTPNKDNSTPIPAKRPVPRPRPKSTFVSYDLADHYSLPQSNSSSSANDATTIVIVKKDCDEGVEGTLKLKKGELVTVISKKNDEWEGIIHASGLEGTFNKKYVRNLRDSERFFIENAVPGQFARSPTMMSDVPESNDEHIYEQLDEYATVQKGVRYMGAKPKPTRPAPPIPANVKPCRAPPVRPQRPQSGPHNNVVRQNKLKPAAPVRQQSRRHRRGRPKSLATASALSRQASSEPASPALRTKVDQEKRKKMLKVSPNRPRAGSTGDTPRNQEGVRDSPNDPKKGKNFFSDWSRRMTGGSSGKKKDKARVQRSSSSSDKNGEHKEKVPLRDSPSRYRRGSSDDNLDGREKRRMAPIPGHVVLKYTARTNSELSLAPGEAVTVIRKESKNWWIGRTARGEGRFPASNVDIKSRNRESRLLEA